MITIIALVTFAVGIFLGKKYGTNLTKSAIEAEFVKVEAIATVDVKALIAKIRAAV